MGTERKRIAIREATEQEALDYGRFGGRAIPRFLIVDADEPEKNLQYGGNLYRGEGSDFLRYTISQARRWERKGYRLILTAEQKMIEQIAKAVDINSWYPPRKIAEDPAVAVAKYDRIARIVCPEAFWDGLTEERELFDNTYSLKTRREKYQERIAVDD